MSVLWRRESGVGARATGQCVTSLEEGRMSVCLRLLCVLASLLYLVSSYEANFETVDVDSILSNRRLMEAYTRCYLDKGPCAPPAKEAKKYLAEVFRTNCGKCTKEQKKQLKTAFNKLMKLRPQDFMKIFSKYNPGNTHLNSFTRWLKSPEL